MLIALRGCTTEPSGGRDKRSWLLWSYEWPGISSQQSCSRTAQLRLGSERATTAAAYITAAPLRSS
jgi:hypothetical protein